MMKHIKINTDDGITPMCSNILQFGSCSYISDCNGRHVFTEHDKPVNIPSQGIAKFEIVGIRNPSHFTIELKEYQLEGGKEWISCKEKTKQIRLSLKKLQEVLNHSNTFQIPVVVGGLCVFYSPKKVKWCRCRVLEKE
jgi:hypothetical protein